MTFPKFDTRRQRVVIEYQDHGNSVEWWAMFDDGSIRVFLTPEAALKAVQKDANRGNKGITVTNIEWRHTPAGFVPPKGQMS